MRVVSLSKTGLEEKLFRFLDGVARGIDRVEGPLFFEDHVFQGLCSGPCPELTRSFEHCLDTFLVSLGTDPASWGKIRVPASVFGVAVAFYNCMVPPVEQPARERKSRTAKEETGVPSDPVNTFTGELLKRLPPARDRDTILAFHAVLSRAGEVMAGAGTGRIELLRQLVDLSPLTSLVCLDVHTPGPVSVFASRLLPGWRKRPEKERGDSVFHAEWEQLISELLTDNRIARYIRRRWCDMPETRTACRNVGLLLEILRGRKIHRDFILEFYESYDYFCSTPPVPPLRDRSWPVLDTAGRLLRFTGEGDTAMRVNRLGNEYFVKFLPLLQIITEEEGLPPEYEKLTYEFYRALRSLVDIAGFGERVDRFGAPEFESI